MPALPFGASCHEVAINDVVDEGVSLRIFWAPLDDTLVDRLILTGFIVGLSHSLGEWAYQRMNPVDKE
jgi:hypothetical protein